MGGGGGCGGVLGGDVVEMLATWIAPVAVSLHVVERLVDGRLRNE